MLGLFIVKSRSSKENHWFIVFSGSDGVNAGNKSCPTTNETGGGCDETQLQNRANRYQSALVKNASAAAGVHELNRQHLRSLSDRRQRSAFLAARFLPSLPKTSQTEKADGSSLSIDVAAQTRSGNLDEHCYLAYVRLWPAVWTSSPTKIKGRLSSSNPTCWSFHNLWNRTFQSSKLSESTCCLLIFKIFPLPIRDALRGGSLLRTTMTCDKSIGEYLQLVKHGKKQTEKKTSRKKKQKKKHKKYKK